MSLLQIGRFHDSCISWQDATASAHIKKITLLMRYMQVAAERNVDTFRSVTSENRGNSSALFGIAEEVHEVGVQCRKNLLVEHAIIRHA